MDKNSEYIHSTTKKLVKAESRIVALETNCKRLQEVCLDKDARIAELEAAQQWLSVEDRLPEKMDRYWVNISNETELYQDRVIYSASHGGWIREINPVVIDHVTHWMPLPPEPKT